MGGGKIYTNRNVEATFLFDFYTRYRPIDHRLATIHNAASRHTVIQNRNRPPMLSSISGLTDKVITTLVIGPLDDRT